VRGDSRPFDAQWNATNGGGEKRANRGEGTRDKQEPAAVVVVVLLLNSGG